MPVKLFAYFDISNPMVAWEVAIGRVRSVCDLNQENFGISIWHYKRLKQFFEYGQVVNPKNEFLLELVRQKEFAHEVSRLRGVFFFESQEMLELALPRWGIKCDPNFVSEVNFFSNKLTRLDSEWITHKLPQDSNDFDWMKSYWSGSTFGDKPLIEVIGSGIGNVLNIRLRELAYNRIMNTLPHSTPLLALAIAVFATGSLESVAQVCPAILTQGDLLIGRHFINMRDIDENQELVGKMYLDAKKSGLTVPVVQHPDPSMLFSVPEMRQTDFKFKSAELAKLHNEILNLLRSKT